MSSPRVVQLTGGALVPLPELQRRIAAAGASGRAAAIAVQLREPGLPAGALLELGRALLEALAGVGGRLIVNDRLDVALALGVRAAHLGGRSVSVAEARRLLGPGAWVSVACHSIDDVVHAADEGASAALLSPIFPSPGKGAPLGLGALTRARAALEARGLARLELIALGGVDAASAAACLHAGAAAVASIRGDLTGLLAGSGAPPR